MLQEMASLGRFLILKYFPPRYVKNVFLVRGSVLYSINITAVIYCCSRRQATAIWTLLWYQETYAVGYTVVDGGFTRKDTGTKNLACSFEKWVLRTGV